MYMKNFGEFFNDQVENAGCIVLSHTDTVSASKIETAVSLLREHNPTAVIVTTPWNDLTGAQLLEAMERTDTLEAEMARLAEETHGHSHGEHHHPHHDHDEECHCHDHDNEHHHHHNHDEECCCHDHDHEHHHHHDHGEECHCHDHEHEHHHHHHDDGEECHCHDHDHEHHHHHDHDEECCCHDHDHEHHHHHDGECCCGHDHHHHHADEVFVSCGAETTATFDRASMTDKLNALTNEGKYGIVLRAKGIVAATDGGNWIHFDYVPGEPDVREGGAAVIGRLCIIGANLNIPALSELFGVELK